MKLEQLHADADLLRRHSLPLAAAPHRAIADAELPPAAADWPPDVRPMQRDGDALQPADPGWPADASDIAGATETDSAAAARLPPLFAADEGPWPPPPPPSADARARAPWIERLAQATAAARVLAQRGAASAIDAAAAGNAPTRRQPNLAPWLAAGIIGIVLLALAAGLISHQRVDAEAAQLVEAKRKVAEQALSLLHAADRPAGAPPPEAPPPSGAPPAGEPAPRPATDLPAEGRARHDAMLASIKGGTVLASLPPSALAQPSPLPVDLPPASVAAAGAARTGSAPAAARPAKKVALVVEGAPAAAVRSAPPSDPLAGTAVRGTLKGAASPQHRVYQLRESEGEWLGFVARADADPLAAGVWAGSGDLLAGGWRVAEVTSQRLTLVGTDGVLEILRP